MQPQLFFVQLTVSDWSASLAWYQRVFRLDVKLLVDEDQFALLQGGGGQHEVKLAIKKGPCQPGTSLLTWKVSDLEWWLAHLQGCAVPLEGPIKTSPEGYRRARFRDPDGYQICLFEEQAKPGGDPIQDRPPI